MFRPRLLHPGPFVAWCVLALLVPATRVVAQEAPVSITFLDVGQGDAVVIGTPDGRYAMVDAGPDSPLRQLTRLGVEELELLVATHAHVDHIGGLDDVLTARPVDTFLDNGTPDTSEAYLELMAHVERLDVRYLRAVPRTLLIGDVSIEVLPLPPDARGQNDRSVGLLVRYGDFVALLPGDAHRRELAYWVQQGVVDDVTLLKAAHHGSRNGFTFDFLERALPEVVVISVGAENTRGHPRPEALAAYISLADRILRTDRDGTVTVLGFHDGSYDVVAGAAVTAADPAVAEPSPGADVPTPVPAPDATGLGGLLSVTVYAGADEDGLNDEYVVIENRSRTRLGIGLWRLCDLSSRCFRFPPGSTIGAGRSVVVFTGYGTTDGVSFFMNNARPVWNDNGDEATLLDAGGTTIVRHVYEEE